MSRSPVNSSRVRRGQGSRRRVAPTPINITLKQIRAFVAVADTGSFTAAAVVVNSTQSSLSVLIRELEDIVGLLLFDRTTRKLALTDAGKEYLTHARRIIAEVEHAHLSTSELVGRKRGRIVVAAAPIIAAVLLPPVVERFHRTYPNISIVVEDIPPSEIAAGVVSGQFDCGLGVFNSNLEAVEVTPVMDERLLLICPAGHPLAAALEVKWADLRDLPIVAIKAGSDIRRELDIRLRVAGIVEPPVIEVRQMTSVLGMVAAGLGVAIWPSWATEFLDAFGVQAVPLVKPVVQLPLLVIHSKTRVLSPAASSFTGALIDGVRQSSAAAKEARYTQAETRRVIGARGKRRKNFDTLFRTGA